MKTVVKLWIFIAILIALTPLGLWLPAYFRARPAWGEWTPEEIRSLIGFIPIGIARLSVLWNAPIPDYGQGAAGYIASAILGVVVITAFIFLAGRFLGRKD